MRATASRTASPDSARPITASHLPLRFALFAMENHPSSAICRRAASMTLKKGLQAGPSSVKISRMSISQPIVFEPLPMERVWGGRRLESLYGKALPSRSADRGILGSRRSGRRPERRAHRASSGHHSARSVDPRIAQEIFGAASPPHPAPRFPMLIKLLDARDRLSVQVHPPACHRPEPRWRTRRRKCEYFADTQPGASIYAGLKRGVTRDLFEKLLHLGRVEEALHVVPVENGQSIFIPSGRLHAIGEGNVIVEVQQNSDTTYRVFDWNRTEPRRPAAQTASRRVFGLDGLHRLRGRTSAARRKACWRSAPILWWKSEAGSLGARLCGRTLCHLHDAVRRSDLRRPKPSSPATSSSSPPRSTEPKLEPTAPHTTLLRSTLPS